MEVVQKARRQNGKCYLLFRFQWRRVLKVLAAEGAETHYAGQVWPICPHLKRWADDHQVEANERIGHALSCPRRVLSLRVAAKATR